MPRLTGRRKPVCCVWPQVARHAQQHNAVRPGDEAWLVIYQELLMRHEEVLLALGEWSRGSQIQQVQWGTVDRYRSARGRGSLSAPLTPAHFLELLAF